ncbi:MAG TPA: gliding motility-associated C-terminal domain-containing protein [Chryseolinea sp.]|nr:gliding motility-associated C-terminal domain-containing protein [Chryseolinea sp.]
MAATTFDIQVPTVLPGIAPVVGPTQGLALPPDAIAFDSYKNQTNAPQLSLLYRVIPISPIGCKGTEESVIIDIKAEPLMDTSPIPAVCSDNEINVTLKSAIGFLPADKFEIVSINYDPLLLTPLTALPALPTGLVNADFIENSIWENITSSNQEVIYIVRPFSSLTGCFGNPPAPIRVTIQPKPLVTPVAVTEICSGDVLSIPLTSVNIPGATFIWTPVPVAGIIGTTGSTTNTITDQLFNTTLSTISVMYNVRATNPASSPLCVGPSEFVQIDVRPSPPVITPLDKITCSDDFGGSTSAQDLTLLHPQISTEPGVTFTWFTDANDSINSKIPIADITAYTLSDEVPVYVRVRNPAASSGCAKVSTVTFDIRPTPELLLDPRETTDPRFNITCNNQNNGEVEVSAQFGTNHTFRVDGSSFIPALLFSNLSAGFHTFSTMNAEGCITDEQVELLQPDPIVPGLPNVVNVSCFNDPSPDGQISINATGGTSMLGGDPLLFSVLQDPSNVYDPITETFSGLRASTYTVRIQDANGCTQFVPNIVVGQPNDLKLTIDITSNYNGFDVSCNGQTDGEISVLTTTGGTPGYTYTLLDENLNPTGNVSGQLNGVFTNLAANILYSVRVSDNRGCEKISIPEYLFDPIPLNAGAIGFDKDICEGGDPTAFTELAEPFGGINLYTFEWLESSDNVNFVPATGVRTNSTYDPPILTSQMFYKRSVTSGTCAAEETDAFTVVVHSKPVATLDAPLQVCQGQTFILDFQFSNGQAPYFFDYFDGTNTASLIGSDSRPVPISNYNATKTFTLTHLRDFYGCEPDAYPPSVTPIMINMDATFSVAPTLAQCSGGNFTFSYTRNPDVEYVWSFNDGSSDRIIAAFTGAPPLADTVQHIFGSVNVSGDTKYPVTLKARSTLTGINCENQSLPQNVTISPNLFINLVADKDEICSGETVTYINSTLAANANHRWFYRTQGGDPAEVLGERNFTSASTQTFVYTNTSPALVTYELVYQVNNGSCADEIVLPVIVHRAITAGIDTTSTTKFIGGNAFANIINTSSPQNDVDFRYEWQFDAGSVPSTFNGLTPPQIRYTSIGEKTISLTVTNTIAEARGLTCGDDASMLIYILLPGIEAGFSYTPQATCFPSDISITENRGTGDLFEWKLRKVNDSRPLLISNDSLPTFKVVSPGFYVIEFKTTNSITGQFREVDNSATPIEIFDLPFASFEARPPTLYVPDEKLIITNRSSDASQYDWDSGAGETSMLPEPTFTYSNAGKYTVTLVAGFNHGAKDFDGDGIIDGDLICYDTARQEITAKEGGLTRIPNAFTPSTNGPNGGIPGGGTFNDVFIPITKGVEEFEMTIFDRWGNLIFQSTNKNVGWDGYDKNGVLLPAGVYVYKLTMRLSNDQRTTQVGDVTLIR